MSDIAISIRGLSKSYGRVQALRELDLIRPQRGEIRVLGMDARHDSVGVRARCGYLPGELNVDDNLTVNEVLRFGKQS
jgi:ABC-type multidrug transport system ATPase subunit